MCIRARRTGFTLIELLVVIAIIAILAAILFPIFTSAKENARTSSCSSNLKQIYTGLMGYCEDNQGKMPDFPQIGAYQRVCMSDPTPPLQISTRLLKYVGNKIEVFKCPSDNLVPRMVAGRFDLMDPNWTMCDWAVLGCSYQWRFMLLSAQKPYLDAVPPQPLPVPDPINGKTVSFCPRSTRLGIARDAVPFHRNMKKQVSTNWTGNSASNMLFLDGHVRLIRGDAYGSTSTTDRDMRF